ncbi:hypothetical protein HFD88_007115 [Aspergillus terreus]|nr:hypothetical protein HFD88_007115 [Aspergillus terreus]
MSSTATPGSSDAGEQPAPSTCIDQGEKKQQPSTEGKARYADYDAKIREILKQQQERRNPMTDQMRSGTSDPPSQSNPSITAPFPYLGDMSAERQDKPDQPAACSGSNMRGAEPLQSDDLNVLMEQLAPLDRKLQYMMRRANDSAKMARKLFAELEETCRARPPRRDNVPHAAGLA